MVGQSVRAQDFDHGKDDFPVEIESGIGNPFPGLRPFSADECHLYFGREGQVDDLLLSLTRNKFVTIMGYSGSGKSSLMHCGLIPVLQGGLVTSSGPNWQIILSRPGISPFETLADSIVNFLIAQGRIEEEDRKIHRAIMVSILRSGPDGLVEVGRYLQTDSSDNVFILIDQFEELFRHDEKVSAEERFNESQAFVNIILRAIEQDEVPIYISIGMRSDFIGQCSQFPKLTYKINKSNYLVPQMSREQKRMAIEGPIAVGGGRISQRLVNKLLSEIGKEQDQLPILQHALMRTWDYWIENHEQGEPIDLRHYYAIGRIAQALSQHANEEYDNLTSRDKEIAEVLFKSITEKNQENRGMRRPCRLGLIAELTEASEADVIRVVEHFRRPGRSFLMPAGNVPLNQDTVIELSHESIMRIWDKLDRWVEEEFESAGVYKRISEAAAMYQIGKTGLWRPPDLQLALNWQKKQRPTRAWAQRYDEAFERAIVFLDTSRITYEAELKNQEMLQRRMLRRTRATAVILGIAALVAVVFLLFAVVQKIAADEQTLEATAQKEDADKSRSLAEDARVKADSAKNEAFIALDKLTKSEAALKAALITAQEQREIAITERNNALVQERIAKEARDTAVIERQIAVTQRLRADSLYLRADTLYMRTIAQALAAKSAQEDDDDQLAGLEAMQGFLIHRRYAGKTYDPYIYNGLYHALRNLIGSNYNKITVPGPPKNRIWDLELTGGNNLFAAGADGRIFKGDLQTLKVTATGYANPYGNKEISISTDERYLANGSDSSVQIYDLTSPKTSPVKEVKGSVADLAFIPNSNILIVVRTDNSILKVEASGGVSQLVTIPFPIKSIDISPDGTLLAGGSLNGSLILMDLRDNTYKVVVKDSTSKIRCVKFNPTGSLIAYGTEEIATQWGTVKMYNIKTAKLEQRQFPGHKAPVNSVAFSPDGKLMASAGSDKRLQMWVLDSERDLPVQMDDNGGFINDIAFTNDSNFLLAACEDSEIKKWSTNPASLAAEICPKLTRNMTPDEWEKHVGSNIAYETTCVTLLIKDFQ